MQQLLMPDQANTEYTEFGVTADRLMAARQIRTLAELDRRIEAMGGYPRSISPTTIGNYFKGLHTVPWEFFQYLVSVLDTAKPLTADELRELERNYAWHQRRPGVGGITPENVRLAREYIARIEAKKGVRRMDDPKN